MRSGYYRVYTSPNKKECMGVGTKGSQFWRSEVQNGCHVAALLGRWQGCVPSEGFVGESASLPVPASGCGLRSLACGCWLAITLLQPLLLLSYLLLRPWHPCLPVSVITLWWHWAHPDNPGYSPQFKPLNFITASKSFLPHKVMYSQVPGIRTWSSLVRALFCLPQKYLVTRTPTPQGRGPRVAPRLLADPSGQINIQHGAAWTVRFGSRDLHVAGRGRCWPCITAWLALHSPDFFRSLPQPSVLGTLPKSRTLPSASESASQSAQSVSSWMH